MPIRFGLNQIEKIDLIELVSTISVDRVLPTQPMPPHRTFLFVDMSGSTQTLQQLGAQDAVYRNQFFLKVVRAIAEHNHGTLVNTVGDEGILVFENVNNAVITAAAIHQILWTIKREINADESSQLRRAILNYHGPLVAFADQPLSCKAAIATGEALPVRFMRQSGARDGDDFVGYGINLTARLASLAPDGSTLLDPGALLAARQLLSRAEYAGSGWRIIGQRKVLVRNFGQIALGDIYHHAQGQRHTVEDIANRPDEVAYLLSTQLYDWVRRSYMFTPSRREEVVASLQERLDSIVRFVRQSREFASVIPEEVSATLMICHWKDMLIEYLNQRQWWSRLTPSMLSFNGDWAGEKAEDWDEFDVLITVEVASTGRSLLHLTLFGTRPDRRAPPDKATTLNAVLLRYDHPVVRFDYPVAGDQREQAQRTLELLRGIRASQPPGRERRLAIERVLDESAWKSTFGREVVELLANNYTVDSKQWWAVLSHSARAQSSFRSSFRLPILQPNGDQRAIGVLNVDSKESPIDEERPDLESQRRLAQLLRPFAAALFPLVDMLRQLDWAEIEPPK